MNPPFRFVNIKHVLTAVVFVGVAASLPAHAATEDRPGGLAASPAPPVVSVPVWSNGLAGVGSVQVDPAKRAVIARGWVNQVIGAIELLACGPGGKAHESVFVLDVNPLDLQTAILLLGVKPGMAPTGLGAGQPKGTGCDLWVDWQENGRTRSERAERFVFNVENRKVLPKTPWIFTGSVIEDGEFRALTEQSLIATYWDPWAIINLPLTCGSNDEILVVNTNTVPPLKTPITMRMQFR